MNIVLQPVAFVKNTRTDVTDDFWGSVISEIQLDDHIPTVALDGVDTFSHLEIIFHFNQSDAADTVFSGHPRGNTNWPHIGIFAQRKKNRPNAIGLTVVEVVKRDGRSVWVKYLDAIDGTPVLDIKPLMKGFLPTTTIKEPEWCNELMKDYWAC